MTKPLDRPVIRRCAIYTRKSSEEGLEQSFNSLHAQREACEAYIKSQAHEGWICLPTAYDDGGFSGGSMDRPGLQALLADIAQRRVDVVVVYKVDRLTRSLGDFARIVETFEASDVSFVSVTQAFNTTSSMGRLTLNVLLSFAQFEREVTGERIRDKIAASKAKGIWMGGNLPLGYDTKDRALVVNESEAAQVQHIFERYLALGSVDGLARELRDQGHRSKVHTTQAGNVIGGTVFGRGALYHLLQNRVYRGQIVHKDKVHPGLHPAIIDEWLFEDVQQRLEGQRVVRSQRAVRQAQAKLTGRVFWADGTPLTPTFAIGRNDRAHGYYSVASAPLGGRPCEGAPRRVPAVAFERFVLQTLQRLAGAPDRTWAILEPALLRVEVRAEDTHVLIDPGVLLGSEHPEVAVKAIRGRLAAGEECLIEPGQARRLRIVTPLRAVFRGGRTWLTNGAGEAIATDPNAASPLTAALKRGHTILAEHNLAPEADDALRAATSPTNPYHRKLAQLAFLAPGLQLKILQGAAPASLTLQAMMDNPPPLNWADQSVWFAALGNSRAGPVSRRRISLEPLG